MYKTYWRDDIVKDPKLYTPGTSYWLYGGMTPSDNLKRHYENLELEKYGVPLTFSSGKQKHSLVGVIYFKDEDYPLDINLDYISKVLSSDSYQLTEPHEYFSELTNWLDKDAWSTGEQWIMLKVVKFIDQQTINFRRLPFRRQE